MDYKKILRSRRLRLMILRFLSFVPDRTMLKLQYRVKLGRKLNLNNPKRYTEKVQWYKLYYKNPLLVKCVDKADVKILLKQWGYEEYLVKTIGIYKSPEDINFEKLPKQFVIKNTLGGGGNGVIICRDKDSFDVEGAVLEMKAWTKKRRRVREGGREWPYYSGKQPRILIEEFLDDDNENGLIDYKFSCFNGKIGCIFVLYDRVIGKKAKMTTYDCNFVNIHVSEKAELYGTGVPKPEKFNEMVWLARELSGRFPAVRVDLYQVKGKVYFGELTFYDESGYTQFVPDEFDYRLGKLFNLENIKENNI